MRRPERTVAGLLAGLLAVVSAAAFSVPAQAEESVPTVQVEVLAADSETGLRVEVVGEGFNPATNPGDDGVYVMLAPADTEVNTDSRPGGESHPTVWVAAADFDGDTFTTEVGATPEQVTVGVDHAIFTWQAHGHSNDSQDTRTLVDIDWEAYDVTPDPDPEPTPDPTPDPEPTPDPTPTPGPDPEDELREVSDAVLNWGVSDQTNARSHSGDLNVLSAGVANPGGGNAALTRAQWKSRAGKVTVQKRNSAGKWKRATWNGLGTDANGDGIGIYGPFSGHRVNITGGTGEIDPGNNSAELAWKGTFTVVYYGGLTAFTLTDPGLSVSRGAGVLTATAGGWAADRDDPSKWIPVDPVRVTLATVSDVKVTEEGLVVTPDYEGVRVTGTVQQRVTGDGWGSFHQEFVTFLGPLGTDQFWYSTGLESDWTKLPSPVSVGWEGAAPPETDPPKEPKKRPEPENPVVDPPPVSDPPPASTPSPAPTAVPALPTGLPFPATASRALDFRFPGQPAQVTAAAPDLRPVSATSARDAGWYAAGVLFLGAAVLLLLVPGRTRTTS